MTVSTQRRAANQAGFTLIELSVVMVIIGILVAALVPVYENYYRQAQVDELKSTNKEVRNALGAFRDGYADTTGDGEVDLADLDTNRDGRFTAADTPDKNLSLPCPAPRTAAIGTANFGRADCPTNLTPGCNATTGVCVIDAGGGERIFIGSVPTSTLSIPGSFAFDPYGNKLTYAVSARLTGRGNMRDEGDPGVIQIVNEAGSLDSAVAPFALISHGKDGAGSFTANGVANARGCRPGTTGGDAENCNNDARFRVTARETSSNTDAFYDDMSSYTFADADGSNDQWWTETAPGSQVIYNKNTNRRVSIGKSGNSGKMLEVAGDVDASGSATVKNSITAETGNIVATAGDITASKGNITTDVGSIVSKKDVLAQNGKVTSKLDIETTTGSVTANQNVTAGVDVNASNNVNAKNKVEANAFFYKGDAPVLGAGTPTPATPSSLTAVCPDGKVLTGIKSNSPQCTEQPNVKITVNCPSGQFLTGITAGVPNCAAPTR